MKSVKMPGFTAEASLYKTSVQYLIAATPYDSADSRGVQPQLPNDVWTTDKVCEACGCTVSGFVCNCGLRPDPAKLACIQNGGPAKVMLPVRTGVGIGGGTLRGFRA
jgi:hypothetical protein